MNAVTWSAGIALVVLVGTLIALDIGFRWGRRDAARGIAAAHEGISAVEASSFALLGLLLGFSFAGATTRLEEKRTLLVNEANAMSTAYQRVDLLPAASQPAIREQFVALLAARLRVYDDRDDEARAQADYQAVTDAQQRIWTLAVAAINPSRPDLTIPVLAPINEMMDITTSSWVSFHSHLPTFIVLLLLVTAILSGLLAGYAMAKRARRSWFHVSAYAVLLSLTIYAVLDLDYPRVGVIRIDAAHQALVDLRALIK